MDPVKVYVALGTDFYDSFLTLQWALNNPFNHRITSVVILYSAAGGVNKDYILTPLAPFHSSYVNEEKIKMLEKIEEARTDKILSQFVAFCGKVKAEVIKLEKDEVPLHQKILEMVSTHKITRLVLSLEFMKTVSSWKPRSAIAGAHYVLARKPHFCEVFLIWEGRLVFIRGENDEVLMESDGGVTIAKLRDKNRTVKKWLGRVFQSNVSESAGSFSSHNHWEKYGRDIEDYVNELSKQGDAEDEDDGTEEAVSSELLQNVVSLEEGGVERIEILQDKIRRAQELVLFYKNKAIDDEERQEKANWAISICNNRVEELEASVSNEVSIKNNLNYEWNALKEEISRLEMEMEEKRNSLDSLLELHERLVDKLHLSSSAASLYEAMLEKEEGKRVDVLQRIEELRKQRDLFQLRVESGGDRGAASTDAGCLRRFSTMEISQATDNFSHHLRARDDDDDDDDEGGSAVYVGKIDRMTVSIKVFESQRRNDDRSGDAFARKVKLFGQLKHPHLLSVIGFCNDPRCVVYEYARNGTLHDALFCNAPRRKPLSWHVRIRIAVEISSALGYLHKTPLSHGNLTASKILLDRNNRAKIDGFNADGPRAGDDDVRSDIAAFGTLVLQLLSGKNWRERTDDDDVEDVVRSLDGEWPMDLAKRLCGIALRCLSGDGETVPVLEVEDVGRRADQLVTDSENGCVSEEEEEDIEVPSAFRCPIYQEVMRNPYVAADGYSYELEAIEEWFRIGNGTSPVTRSTLDHKLLTPNHTLKSLIQDWHIKRDHLLRLPDK